MDAVLRVLDIQTISLIITLVAYAAGIVWKLSRVEQSLRADINKSHTEIEAKQERIVHDFGETVAAIRQKCHDIELYSSNNYMRRDSFYKAQEEVKLEIKALGERIEARFVRVETKLDTKT